MGEGQLQSETQVDLRLRGVIGAHGGVLDGVFRDRISWIGFGEVWTRKLVQTVSKTYLGGTRDSF